MAHTSEPTIFRIRNSPCDERRLIRLRYPSRLVAFCIYSFTRRNGVPDASRRYEVARSASGTSWRLPEAPCFVAEQFPPNTCRTAPGAAGTHAPTHLTVWSRIEGTISQSACIGGLYERARARVHGAWHCLWRSDQRLPSWFLSTRATSAA